MAVHTTTSPTTTPPTPTTQPTAPPAPGTRGAWHTLSVAEVHDIVRTSPAQGLSSTDAARRLDETGPNELIERPGRSVWSILWEQLTNPLVLLLVGAAVVSGLLGKFDSLIAIAAIVVLNAALGVYQEHRAERAIAALKKMSAPSVRVRRDGQVMDVPSRELVPGDVFLMEAGTIIPADARLHEAANLRVEEASLTGESAPVTKHTAPIPAADAPLGDRLNMVYMGTSVAYGRGEAVVVDTGMATELGHIADLLQSVEDEKTPLQRRMDEVGNVLLWAALVVMGVAFVIGLWTGQAFQEVLLNAVAIAVAVVPEGLPAVVTVALALGAQRMLRQRALIRRLPAVETLGSVTTIASDKTGTLTENRMTVIEVDVHAAHDRMDELAQGGVMGLLSALASGQPTPRQAEALTLMGGTLCSDATLKTEALGDTVAFTAVGDPTEGAIVAAAGRIGLLKPHMDAVFPRVAEVPFDSTRKRMSVIVSAKHGADLDDAEQVLANLLGLDPTHYVVFTKGAADSLVEVSTQVWVNGAPTPMTDALRQNILDSNNTMAFQGLRVLGVGYRALDAVPHDVVAETIEHDLTFLGMVGIIDPPRAEVAESVRAAKAAGVRVAMITGDHPLTAYTIARQLNIVEEGGRVVTGQDLNKMSQEALEAQVESINVFARVNPEHKLRVVQALQSRGHVAAMTGDGVNDAPALKRSNIGVAMGITGTDVTKEASNMVILDDNFATIVHAVEEGRTIYDNVRRFIKYLLASNTGELFVLLAAQLISGMTIPLTTLQILWMNLITDGVPALALGVEQGERGSMTRPPFGPKESLFGRGLGRHILLVGGTLGGLALALGYVAWEQNWLAANGAPAWNTLVFFFLTVAQMGHALGLRSHRESIFTINPLSNPLLLGAVVVTIGLQLMAVYLPFFNNLFGTNPLTLGQLGLCAALSLIVFAVVELEKVYIRATNRPS